MASHKSAEKCIRKTIRQTAVNKSRVSRIRTEVKKLERLLEAGSSSDANTLKSSFIEAQRQLMRGVTKGVLHKNTASRKVSRLSKRLKAITLAVS